MANPAMTATTPPLRGHTRHPRQALPCPCPFTSEAAMCKAFAESARAAGWEVWPETEGFDLLLVHKPDGRQFGLQAKLTMNTKVCEQILPGYFKGDPVAGYMPKRAERGPDFRGCIVPTLGRNEGLANMLRHCGVRVITPVIKRMYRKDGRVDLWHFPVADLRPSPDWHDWQPQQRIELLPFAEADRARMPAGGRSPVRLTAWKYNMLRLQARLEAHGHLTPADVAECGFKPLGWFGDDAKGYRGSLVETTPGSGQWVPVSSEGEHAHLAPEWLGERFPATYADLLAVEVAAEGRHAR